MSNQIETTILSAYFTNESYNRIVTSHLKPEYFENEESRIIIQQGLEYTTKNHDVITKTALLTILESIPNIPESIYQRTLGVVDKIYDTQTVSDVKKMSTDWLVTETEKWCIERSAFNVVLKAVDILQGTYRENGKLIDKAAIPDMMQKALAISFDTTIGHDYLDDAEDRFEFMHQKVSKIKFKSSILNKITGGGVERKTENIFLGGIGSGKSLNLCSLASDYIEQGYNVLYITLEMAEQKISERIDANLLNVPLDQLKNIPKQTFLNKVQSFKDNGYGKLIVKEYPTATANCNHFRFLLQELETKQGFVPDIVFLDYLSIATSVRYRTSDSLHQVVKSISEEFRGLAVEKNFVGWTAVQLNRGGYNSVDPDMTDVADSFSLFMVADFVLAIISTDELAALNQYRYKQLKNRYGDPTVFNSFLLSVDKSKMRVYEQPLIVSSSPSKKPPVMMQDAPDTPLFDKSISNKRTGNFTEFIV